MRKFGCGQRWAEEEALSFRAAVGPKVGPLLLRFYALGNHDMLETLAHINYGADHRGFVGVGTDLIHKRLINFQGIEGKPPEIAQAGIAGPEVIHGKVYPHGFEFL